MYLPSLGNELGTTLDYRNAQLVQHRTYLWDSELRLLCLYIYQSWLI